MRNYNHDVFIAYHGTFADNGTYTCAMAIAKFLREDYKYDVYLFDASEGQSWENTPREVRASRVMLVVLNDDVILDDKGCIAEKREDGSRNQLFAEISEFKKKVNEGQRAPQTLNFVYCGDKKNGKEARSFCEDQADGMPSLNNVIAADYYRNNNKEDYTPVAKWVEDAILIQKNFDSSPEDQTDQTDQNFTVDNCFARIEKDMFEQNCVAILGPTLNPAMMNFAPKEKGNFFDKCEALEQRGRNFLNSAINSAFEDKGNCISSNIKHLVKFPFSAFLTTDYYLPIKDVLDSKKSCIEIHYKDKEEQLYELDLQHGQLPIFYLERSDIWKDDCLCPTNEISTVIKMILRGRRLIYVGYNNDYQGYKTVGKTLKSIVGERFFTPDNNFAIVGDDDTKGAEVYKDSENGFTIIKCSVDNFINKLKTSNDLFKKLLNMNDGDNKFINDLFNIASTPTETQAIQLLLKQLSQDIDSRMDIGAIISKYDNNVKCLKNFKPNFNAFEKSWLKIKDELLDNTIPETEDLKAIVEKVNYERTTISNGIRRKGKDFLSEKYLNSTGENNILLFSQSLRVIEFLIGAKNEFKAKSNLWVCECRPKSSEPFVDAKNTCELLKESSKNSRDYLSITIIPDMASFNLMQRNKINLIVLGAHDVVLHNSKPVSFINTCGSIAIMEFAKIMKIPVCVVAECGKFTEAKEEGGKLVYSISYGHESTIYKDFNFALWAKDVGVKTRNIGYDFCRFYNGVYLTNEKEIIKCEDVPCEVELIDTTKEE